MYTIIVAFFLLLINTFGQTTYSSHQKDTAYSFDNVPIVYEKTGSNEFILIFVHGWSCDKSYWGDQLEYFGSKYSVVAVDLAGHGESGLNRKEWTIENYGKDVKAVVEKENLNNIILIGHSMGGAIVLSVARQLNDKVKALVGIDTYHDIEYKYSDEQLKEFYTPFEKDFAVTAKEFVKGMFPENADSNLVEKISIDMSSAPPEVALASFRAFFKYDEAKNFEKINIPVRFLNADAYPTNTEAAKRHIKDFDLKIMKGTGHFLMLEKPDEFNKLLEETITEFKN